MSRHRSGYVRVSVDVSEIIDEIEDDHLLEEVENRGLIDKRAGADAVPFADVEDAFDALRAGDAAEALLILERLVRPKWGSLALAEADYAKATGRQS